MKKIDNIGNLENGKDRKEAQQELKEVLARASALQAALAMVEWDNETLSPKAAGEQTSRLAGVLSGLYYGVMTGEELGELLRENQKAKQGEMDQKNTGKEEAGQGEKEESLMDRMAEEAEKERKNLSCVPREEYEEFTCLTSSAGKVWAEAKEKQDFALFAPSLEKIISFRKKMASYRKEGSQTLYDVMLDEFEESFPEEKLDEFFGIIREELVPFLEKLKKQGRKIDNSFLYGNYPREKQEKLARMMAEYIGFDFDRGVLAVSAHPFTTSFHNKDVRMTTHYDNWLDHSLFSVIHEGGHALYELGIKDELTQTILGQGASMAMHESQSRFMENMIGRSLAFWEPIYGKVQDLFQEQLKTISVEEFVAGINKVEPGLIRTSADELTYSLHIMVRYDLEKQLMKGDLKIEALEQAWADKYEEYLGIRPKNAAEGVLQDIHWSQGSFGYFPSYALGSAFAAQIYRKMRETMDVDAVLRAGEIKKITDYLKENIHCQGKMKTSRQLLKDTTGENFTPKYYIEYLKEKYGKLYLG
ncbi:carboxypeptidase M32 [Lachnospiraceae bacterium 62-35]